MKKLLALLLALAMLLSFAACGSDEYSFEDDDDDEKVEEKEKDKDKDKETDDETDKETNKETNKETSVETKAPAKETTKTPVTESPIPQQPAVDAKKGPSHGTVNGSVYTNNYLGFKFTASSTWIFASDDDLASSSAISVDYFKNADKFEQALKNNQTVYEMKTADSVLRTNVQVLYENLAKSNSTSITEEQYLNIVRGQLEAVTSMTITFNDSPTRVKLGNTEFLRLVANVTSSGVSMKQAYYVHKVDNYMACIISTVPSGATVAQVEAMFS